MNSAFKRSHPAVNLIFFIAAAAFSMILLHPAFLAVSVIAPLCYLITIKGRAILKTFFCALLPLLALVTLINAFFADYGATALITFHSGNSITLEALAYGAVTGAMVVAMILWFMCYNEVFTEDKFMHLFGKRAPYNALLIMMILRFVPLYSRRLRETVSARRAAGLAQGSANKSAKIRNACAAVSGVITWALEHSIETADSMKSRGYGAKRRTSYSRFAPSPADWILGAVIIALAIVTALGAFSGAARASYNPIIQIAELSPMTLAYEMIYIVFSFLPIIYDKAEEIRWNRLYAKT